MSEPPEPAQSTIKRPRKKWDTQKLYKPLPATNTSNSNFIGELRNIRQPTPPIPVVRKPGYTWFVPGNTFTEPTVLAPFVPATMTMQQHLLSPPPDELEYSDEKPTSSELEYQAADQMDVEEEQVEQEVEQEEEEKVEEEEQDLQPIPSPLDTPKSVIIPPHIVISQVQESKDEEVDSRGSRQPTHRTSYLHSAPTSAAQGVIRITPDIALLFS